MNGALLTLVIVYLAFFVYLVSAGVGLQRTGGILLHVGKFAVILGAVFGGIGLFFSPAAGAKTFLVVAIFISMTHLPVAALSRARDFLLPRSSVLAVVSLNVLVLMFPEPVGGFPVFRQILGFVQKLVTNPFVMVVPEQLAWLNLPISLWPSMLALWVASRGARAGRWPRFFPMVWVQVISIVWLIPASLSALVDADLSSVWGPAEVLFAALGLVHVALTGVILRDSLLAQRVELIGERSVDSTEHVGVARRLADSMHAGAFPPLVYVVAALLTWVGIRALKAEMHDADPLLFGFVGIFAASALALRLKEWAGMRSWWAVPAWLVSSAALVASMHWALHSTLLPSFTQKVNARYSSHHLRSMSAPRPAAPTRCPLMREGVWGLQCPDAFIPLADVQHPAGVVPPAELVPSPLQIWDVEWTGPMLQCQEFRVASAAANTRFMLLFVPGADRASQFIWSAEQGGGCSGFMAVTYQSSPGGPVVWDYRWKADTDRFRKEYATRAGVIEALEVAAFSGEEQGPEAEQRREPDAVRESSEDHAR